MTRTPAGAVAGLPRRKAHSREGQHYMIHDELVELYLKEVARRGMRAGELLEVARSTTDLAATTFFDRCLSRPSFLGYAEKTRLTADLQNLHAALTALPERLFGGDVAAFARAVGMTDVQVTAIMRTQSATPTKMARGDLYLDDTGFKLMEVNIGSSVGGGDNVMLNRACLAHPVIAEFVAAHGLTYTDTLAETAGTIFAETGGSAGDGRLIAAVDWPGTIDTWKAVLRTSARVYAGYGIDLVPCHLGELAVHDRRVWLGRRPIDVIYRIFLIEDLLDPDGPALIDPVLRAAERGEVQIFTPMDSQLYASKGALALLSDEANRHLCSAAELASLDRLLPWTRMMRPGPVSVNSEQVELTEYACANRSELVLKPTALHGGIGVVPGWLTDPDDWDSQLAAAMTGSFVLQQRVRPVPELFPADDGPQPLLLIWGAYLAASGYGGMRLRGTPDLDAGVLNMTSGAAASCCFHEAEPGSAGAPPGHPAGA